MVTQLFVDAIRAAGWSATVLGYQRQGDPPATGPGAVAVGERIIETAAGRTAIAGWIARAFLHQLPYSCAKYRSPTYRDAFAAAIARIDPDLVIVDHAQIGWLLDEVTVAAPVVIISHNVEAALYADLARAARHAHARAAYRREANLMTRVEDHLRCRATRVWALTQADAVTLEARAFAVPGTSAGSLAVGAAAVDVALLGTWSWKANREGLEWFAAEVLGRLPRDLSVHVAGKGAQWLVGRHGVEVLGMVPDAAEFLLGARVIAVPSVRGGGVQVKTLDAIATGVPVVASPAALRGIDAPPGSVHCAGSGHDFARELTRLATALPDERVRQDALSWSRRRHVRFFADVAAALRDAVHQRD